MVSLAGRSVAVSPNVPAIFDTPLAPHHQLLGRWALTHTPDDRQFTRSEARAWIERAFDRAVLDILRPFKLAKLRAIVLHGDGDMDPALGIICDSIGELDLGWIGKTKRLKDTLFGPVAPTGWRAAAYQALVETLHSALPIFSYVDLFYEYSTYFWDGETDDDGARTALIEWHSADPADIEQDDLPSGMNARRPDYMIAENADRMRDMPAPLRQKIRSLRDAHKALAGFGTSGHAWRFERDILWSYMPESEDWTWLPSMTLVPFEFFTRELDAVGQQGMQMGFTDVAGLCPLPDAATVDQWLASLRLGADLLVAAQDLIEFEWTRS